MVSSEAPSDLAELQDALLRTDNVQEFVQELAVLATSIAQDSVSCAMALRPRGRNATITACSDPLATAADEAQYQTGDGPCLAVLRHGRPVLVDDTRTHEQWRRFLDQAAQAGIRSCYALPLVNEDEPIGALVLYSRQPSAFGLDLIARATAFGRHAAGALALALRMASYVDLNEQLRASLASRAVIDQALGVIMATEHCPQDRAFALLRSVSQNTNVKLRDLAADIVTDVSGEPPRVTSPFEDG